MGAMKRMIDLEDHGGDWKQLADISASLNQLIGEHRAHARQVASQLADIRRDVEKISKAGDKGGEALDEIVARERREASDQARRDILRAVKLHATYALEDDNDPMEAQALMKFWRTMGGDRE